MKSYLFPDIFFLYNQKDMNTRRNFQHLNIHLHFHMVQNHTEILKHILTILVKGLQRVSINRNVQNKMKSYLFPDIFFLYNQKDMNTRRNFQHLNIHLHFHMVQNHTEILKHIFTILVKGIQRVSTNINVQQIRYRNRTYFLTSFSFITRRT